VRPRTRRYLSYLVTVMGLIAIMDQYLSTIKTTANPYVLEEYGVTAARFSQLEAVFLIVTFSVFLLNGLNDIIGRKPAILVLILMMGLTSLAIVLFTPTLTLFLALYALVMTATFSNMWTIPISEEAPAEQRAKLVSVAYVVGLIPLQAVLPPLLLNTLGLSWKWMYGIMFVFMLPVLVLWVFVKETGRYTRIREERKRGVRKLHAFALGSFDRRDLRYLVVSAAIWICWLVNSTLWVWAGYYYMNLKGYTLAQWSMVLLVTLVMAMAGGVIGGWIMDHLGRRKGLVFGCAGLAVVQSAMGFAPGILLPVMTAATGFFVSLSYTWIVVYVPEVFPTERRGACMGWTTTVARISFVVGPALAAVLLQAFPAMDWFWVITGLIMLIPIGIILLSRPYETSAQELEEIEMRR
ncbi:MAG TPA: MFS transporter, partial [Anaerolineae bacterium]|nr:MFS transporter [Anaerolineae bacterium]